MVFFMVRFTYNLFFARVHLTPGTLAFLISAR
jgi:hypothetical protein